MSVVRQICERAYAGMERCSSTPVSESFTAHRIVRDITQPNKEGTAVEQVGLQLQALIDNPSTSAVKRRIYQRYLGMIYPPLDVLASLIYEKYCGSDTSDNVTPLTEEQALAWCSEQGVGVYDLAAIMAQGDMDALRHNLVSRDE